MPNTAGQRRFLRERRDGRDRRLGQLPGSDGADAARRAVPAQPGVPASLAKKAPRPLTCFHPQRSGCVRGDPSRAL